jgi:hypothetical protein
MDVNYNVAHHNHRTPSDTGNTLVLPVPRNHSRGLSITTTLSTQLAGAKAPTHLQTHRKRLSKNGSKKAFFASLSEFPAVERKGRLVGGPGRVNCFFRRLALFFRRFLAAEAVRRGEGEGRH